MKHFYTYPVTQCICHHSNHNDDYVPTWMFKSVSDDMISIKDFIIKGLVDFLS